MQQINQQVIDKRADVSDYVFVSKYARTVNGKKESWKEAVGRVMLMHYDKLYDQALNKEQFNELFNYAWDFYNQKKILGAQRALQYGGEQIMKHNSRLYNCSYSYIDRIDFFKELMYLLLSGAGVGYSVQKCHVDLLPKLKGVDNSSVDTYVIPDSIEGWSEAIHKLILSYYNHLPKVEFDYSLIRAEGSFISGGFKAPGAEPLKKAINKIDSILCGINNRKLTPFELHRISCIIADAVISGGVRRSAMICLFDIDNEEMLKCKSSGDWFYNYPELCRANNSVVVTPDINYEEYSKIFDYVKNFGEPGIVFLKNKDYLVNPCIPAWGKLLTPDGLKELKDINIGDVIWSKEGWTKVINKWSTGVKDVYRYRTNSSVFYGTNNHQIVQNGKKIEVDKAEFIDSITGYYDESCHFNIQDVMDGLVLGDGSYHKASNKISLNIGMNDGDYFHSEVSSLIVGKNKIGKYTFDVITTLSSNEVGYTYERRIPSRFFGNKNKTIGILRGLYSANGSIVKNRITYKTTSKGLVEDIQLLLSSIGIKSYYTINKKHLTTFNNGVYECKESYDINITEDRDKFFNIIGFIQKYKCDKYNPDVKKGNYQKAFKIIEKDKISTEEVFDITVDNKSHTFWYGGCDVSNCCEVCGKPKIEVDGVTKSGFGFCNLIEINGGLIQTEDDLYAACKAAAILGTFQATYTDFKVLSDTSKKIADRDSLIGVGITGMFSNPKILFNADIQKKAAEIVKEWNKTTAKLLNINPAARTTVVKPSGNSSQLLGVSSGISPYHFRKYIRHIQASHTEQAVNEILKINPVMVEKSFWNPDKEYVVSFPVTIEDTGICRNDLSTLEFLDYIKLTQQNWIEYGTNYDSEAQKENPDIRMNVSNTVSVKDGEWDMVRDYLWDNRDAFCGVSLLPHTGDLDYPQSPYTSYLDEKELVETYGSGAILSSGLIVDGLDLFGTIWVACDTALGKNNKLLQCTNDDISEYIKNNIKDNKFLVNINGISISDINVVIDYLKAQCDKRNYWVNRFNKFAKNYFGGDKQKCANCLKHVDIFHKWQKLKNIKSIIWKDVEWEEEVKNAGSDVAAACHGGACEL